MNKEKMQSFGRFLSGMVMPNIGAFIAWGFITALFIETGWFPNEKLASIVGPMLQYMLPLLIAYEGGKMVGGQRGAVIGAIATIGVICGSEYTMFMGAMLMGPLAGWCIRQFDKAMEGHIPAGFEMLINNFSLGIIGMILAIIGYYLIGPFMGAILGVLNAGVAFLVNHSILPLVSIFVEPAKVLFLNNAINHGIFTPLGAEQVSAAGKSIFYMIETNPGPGAGVLLAYMLFSKDKTTRQSAPGAFIIHFFGGIHEIYFPYVLMNPLLLLATIGGSVSALVYYSLFDMGLAGPPSPGSIIAYLGLAPKDNIIGVIIGVLIAMAVSFVIAMPIVRNMDAKKTLAEAQAEDKARHDEAKGITSASADIRKIVFACDAGMGSSAMGATVLKKKLAAVGRNDIDVVHSSVSEVPYDAELVVCHTDLAERARKSAPNAEIITITNFMGAPEYDALAERLKK